ncbi:hypothetical protein [Streptomyces sp. NPDC088746]|uniref:hypothetical protein n=1 Tax=Streptomyces sp. NPDC088746 TaxID=3365885 RepID=UPI003811874E
MGAGNPLGRRAVFRPLTGGDPLGRERAVVSRETEVAGSRAATAGAGRAAPAKLSGSDTVTAPSPQVRASRCSRARPHTFRVSSAGVAPAEDSVHTAGPRREATEQRSQHSQ